jgi:hypoxanthine phosphoribosyltransferase
MRDLRQGKLCPIPKEYGAKELRGVLIKESEISRMVANLAKEINKSGKKWHCVVVLNGALFFAAELMQYLDCTYDTIQIGSYSGTESNKKPKMKKPLSKPINCKDVLIIEDIVDTGYTIKFLVEYLKELGARTVKTASLVSKPSRRKVEVKIDYLGFLVPDKFLVGYGLDYNEKFRTLPFIAVIR